MKYRVLSATAICILFITGALAGDADPVLDLLPFPKPAGALTNSAVISVPSFPITNYTTSWLGNSYGGPTWVQRFANDMYVGRDGTCYVVTGWDEGGQECGIYKAGKVVGAAVEMHGWGNGGGVAVTANSKYLFVAQSVGSAGHDKSEEIWPSPGTNWFGVGRRNLDGSLARFPSGKGHGRIPTQGGGGFLPINAVPAKERADITGLAASETELFVANPSAGEIAIYNPETMEKTGAWPLPRAGRMTYDPKRNSLWIIQSGEGKAPATICCYTVAGKVINPGLGLPAGTNPSSLSIALNGDLLVGDSGPAQQVLIYGNLDSTPKLIKNFGEKGGIYSGVPGQVALLKFANPVGVGVDADGNIYVASYMGGLVLESYTLKGDRNWELHGLEFTECADVDRASPNDVYTATHHYTLDFTKPSGQDSTYAGYLVDALHYPNDPRLNGWGVGSMLVRNIKGNRLLFGLDMNAGNLQVYRFTGKGELTAPAVVFRSSTQPAKWPPKNHPDQGGWIWRDVNGDGNFDPDEYDASPETLPTTAWSIDSQGDVWTGHRVWRGQTLVAFIRHFPCEGIDEKGNPIYHFKSASETPAPAPFDDPKQGATVTRMQYVAETDTMYLSGFTAAHKNDHRDWKTSGPVICRYDNWRTPKMSKRWEIVVAWESAELPKSNHGCPDAFSVAGERLFNGYLRNGEIRVYDTADGRYRGSLLPGPEVDKTSGWIDTMYGVQASQQPNGDYLIFAEEVWHEKVLMYHLKSK